MPDEAAPEGRTFIVVAFVASAIVGLAVAYLGVTGRIGGPIP